MADLPRSASETPTWIDRLGDPRSWLTADKVLVIAGGTVPFTLLFTALAHYYSTSPDLPSYIDRGFLGTVRAVAGLTTVGWVLTIAVALATRSRPGEQRWLVQLTFFQWCAGTLFMVHCFGAATSPMVLQLLGGAFIGALLFDVSAIRPVAIVTSSLLVAMLFAERMGFIPYAPLLAHAPYEDGVPAPLWFFLTFGVMSAVGVAVFTIGAAALVRWRQREAEVTELNAFLERTFGRYLSPEVMATIRADPTSVELGGRRREVTILISDIRGFTTLSERHTPEQVVALLNRWMRTMIAICERYQGTVTDIVGDELLVVFGAPLELQDAPGAAVACAIEMQNAMAKLNHENLRDGLPELAIGVGVHTAEVVVGNVGSELRSKYGVVGSGVNLTSRIESYTVGGQILVSQAIVDRLGDMLRIDLRKQVRPKGTESTIDIYQIGGLAGGYQITLDAVDEGLQPPLRPLTVHVAVLGADTDGGGRETARVVELSRRGAVLDVEAPLSEDLDLVLNLTHVSQRLAEVRIYAKVVDIDLQDDRRVRVAFTSLPAEVGAYFEGLLHA